MRSDEPFIVFIVLLTVAANLATVVLWGVLASAAASRRGRSALTRVRAELGRSGLEIGAVVAGTATASSLYLSEGLGFTPCLLCWYQRILVYPIAVLLVVAALRRDWGIRPYVYVLGGLAMAVSTYHYVEQHFPEVGSGSCDPSAPCTFRWVWELHYISIPWMALSTSVLVITVLALARPAVAGSHRPARDHGVADEEATAR